MAVTTTLPMYHRSYELPWSSSREDQSRMQRTLQFSLGVVLLLCLIIPYLPLPERSVDVIEAVPPRLAKLVLERRVVPPLTPAPVVPDEAPPEAVRPATQVPEVERPRAQPPVAPDRMDDARRKAASSGLLAMQDQLASLRDNAATAKAVETRDLTASAGEASRSDRALITSGIGKGSGGINTAGLSRGYGSGTGALAGHSTTQVTSTIGDGGSDAGPQVQRSSGSNKASRSREEIELVFDRNKSAIYALYSRALRDNPALQGKVVLQLTIAPSGEITGCDVLSSDLNDPDLERKLVARIKLFRFEARDVEAITTTKPIDFFPA